MRSLGSDISAALKSAKKGQLQFSAVTTADDGPGYPLLAERPKRMTIAATPRILSLRGPYWADSARPLVCLAFVAPMLVIYEAAVFWLGPAAVRNGADVWLRTLLDVVGFGQYFLLPLLTCGILLGWHHARHEPWQLSNRTIRLMWLESAFYALLLLAAAQLQANLMGGSSEAAFTSGSSDFTRGAARLIGYLGAGVYEELLFRLLPIPVLAFALARTGLNRRGSLIIAVTATSLLFALAHYKLDFDLLGMHITLPYGDAFAWFSFSFRFTAGLLFGALFAMRGFGIACGTHALYDLMVALL